MCHRPGILRHKQLTYVLCHNGHHITYGLLHIPVLISSPLLTPDDIRVHSSTSNLPHPILIRDSLPTLKQSLSLPLRRHYPPSLNPLVPSNLSYRTRFRSQFLYVYKKSVFLKSFTSLLTITFIT